MKKRQIIIITGKTGTGKSRFGMELISRFNRAIIIDEMSEYNLPDAIIFYSFLDLTDYIKENENESFIYICRFENESDIDFLFKLSWILTDVCLVMEECYSYISQQAKDTFFIRNLVNRGRHRNISIIAILQRFPDLHINLRSQVNTFISFRQDNPYDLERMKPYGFDSEKLRNLADFQFEWQGENIFE